MKRIVKKPVIDQVIDSIKNSIIGGEFKVGKKLPSELSLCESLNVSRSTIREAFRVLHTMGYIELKAGKGAFVRDSDPHDVAAVRNWFRESAPQLEDFTVVREAIEVLAVKIAINHCSEKEVSVLEDINNAYKKAVDENSATDTAKYDEEFHNQIFLMTKNTLLINLNRLVAVEFRKYRVMSFSMHEHQLSAVEPHNRILDAVKRRDVNDGIAYMQNHLRDIISQIINVNKMLTID